MNLFDKKMRRLAAKENDIVSKDISDYVDSILVNLPEKEHSEKSGSRLYGFLLTGKISIATVFLLFVLTNISPQLTYAMENVPILGSIVRVITIRNYFYDKGNGYLDAEIPQVQIDSNTDVQSELNTTIEQWTNQIMQQFYKDVEYYGENMHLYTGIRYKKVMDTPKWFTLQIEVTETAASTNTYYRYYHINKETEQIVKLSDLFQQDSGYEKIITKDIKRQMKEQMEKDSMKVYWIEEDSSDVAFQSISSDTNFYFNKEGQLVIVFDKYQVAPGYMGCPEFVIEKSVYQDCLKEEL